MGRGPRRGYLEAGEAETGWLRSLPHSHGKEPSPVTAQAWTYSLHSPSLVLRGISHQVDIDTHHSRTPKNLQKAAHWTYRDLHFSLPPLQWCYQLARMRHTHQENAPPVRHITINQGQVLYQKKKILNYLLICQQCAPFQKKKKTEPNFLKIEPFLRTNFNCVFSY